MIQACINSVISKEHALVEMIMTYAPFSGTSCLIFLSLKSYLSYFPLCKVSLCVLSVLYDILKLVLPEFFSLTELTVRSSFMLYF